MQKLIISLIFYLTISPSLQAQDDYLSFIDDEKQNFFRNNGWELYYSNDDLKFYDYLIHNGQLVLASSEGYDYNIHFLNNSRLIEKSKRISGTKYLHYLPKLYLDKDNIVFAPMQKLECRIIPEKERIKKRNRFKNRKKRKQGEFFKKYLHYRDYTFYSFASLDKESGHQKVEIKFGTDEKNLSTLYVAQIKSDGFTYSANADRIELEFINDRILLVDNFDNKLLSFDFDGKMISEKQLSEFEKSNNVNYFSDAILRNDPTTNTVYLVFHRDLYQILLQKDNLEFNKINLISEFRFYKPRIYDNHFYALFSLREDKGMAIYRKELN
jgi:hypothetical protein